jgi:hypothetical protein
LEYFIFSSCIDWRTVLGLHDFDGLVYLVNRFKERRMSEDRDPHKAVDYILKHAALFAKAKAERTYIEQYRKSLKGILMKRSMETAIGAQERDAYAHPEMVQLLEGLKAAVEIEEKLKWDITAAELRVEIWRTEQANNRAEGKATQ